MPDEPNTDKPLNPDLMGYTDVESLVAAKRASDQEAIKLRQRADRADELERQFAALQVQALQAQANPRQDVRVRGTLDDRLNDAGIPSMDIRELAREVVRAELEPIARGVNARNTVLAQYPDYNKFESDVAQFIQSDPNLNQTYQRLFVADPVGAFEYAFLKFGESRRRTHQPEGSESLMQEVGSHAGIPTSRSGDARRIDRSRDETASAWEQWQKTGSQRDANAYAKARLKTAISDDFLNQ